MRYRGLIQSSVRNSAMVMASKWTRTIFGLLLACCQDSAAEISGTDTLAAFIADLSHQFQFSSAVLQSSMTRGDEELEEDVLLLLRLSSVMLASFTTRKDDHSCTDEACALIMLPRYTLCSADLEITPPPNVAPAFFFNSCRDQKVYSHKPLTLDSQIFSYHFDTNTGLIEVTEYYAIKKGPIIQKKIGTWIKDKGFDGKIEDIWIRRRDLNGVLLTNAVLPFGRFLMDDGPTLTYSKPRGFFIDILSVLASNVNLTAHFVPSSDGQWGVLTENGTWNGMVGMLARGEADLCTAALSVTLSRSTAIDYTISLEKDIDTLSARYGHLFLSENTCFFFASGFYRVPRGTPFNFWAYVDVFTKLSWIIMVLLLASLALLLYLVSALGIDVIHPPNDSEMFSLLNSAALQMNLIVQRTYDICQRRPVTKLIYHVSCLYAFAMFAVYSAVLTSLMTSGTTTIPIDDFSDVLASDFEYRVIVMRGSSNEAGMAGSLPGTPLHTIYYEMMAGNKEAFVSSTTEARKAMIEDGNVLYFGSKVTFLIDPDILVLNVKDALYGHIAFGLQKGSEFYDIFNYYLLKMEQSGFLDMLHQKWLENPYKDDTKSSFDGNTTLALGYDNVLFPFLGLGWGLLASAVLALLEWIRQTSKGILNTEVHN